MKNRKRNQQINKNNKEIKKKKLMIKMARKIRKINIRSRIQGERKNTKLNEKSAVSRY